MQVAIPFDDAFASQAIRMLGWIAELSGRQEETCVLVTTKDTDKRIVDEVRIAAQRAFCGVVHIQTRYFCQHQWPETPNALFVAMADYAKKMGKQPFFWMEVDCVPLKRDWLKRLSREYESAGKPYMGFRRDIPIPHISGPAIYPADVSRYNPESLRPHANRYGLIPFDTVFGHQTLKHAAITRLIQHEWGTREEPPTFPTIESLKLLNRDAVLFHRVKDASLISRLRETNPKNPINKIKVMLSGLSNIVGVRHPNPTLVMVYIHVPGDRKHRDYADKFVESYLAHPPQYGHRTIIVTQGSKPDVWAKERFSVIPNVSYYVHDDSGWDIGAFIAVSHDIGDEIQLCFGGSSYFKRSGWMKRMVAAWNKHGPGFYGVTGTYEVSPHLNTSGFWCPPSVLSQYPVRVVTKVQRYTFEHGDLACWKIAAANGLPCKLVTWCGEYDWRDWRKPKNIFRRGNQSNILAYWHHCEKFDTANKAMREAMSRNTDTLTDPVYLKLMGVKVGDDLERQFHAHFCRQHGLEESSVEIHQMIGEK